MPAHRTTGAAALGNGRSSHWVPMKRQLDTLIAGARSIGAKFIIGSAGTAGGERNLQAVRELVEQIAKETRSALPVALLHAEMEQGLPEEEAGGRQDRPARPVPELTEEDIDSSEPIVGHDGRRAVHQGAGCGADVILGGRATDPAIFAGPPLLGRHPARYRLACRPHHGQGRDDDRPRRGDRVARDSCSSAMTTSSRRPPKKAPTAHLARCAAVTLYENDSPYHTIMPSGVIDTSAAVYEAIDDGKVRSREASSIGTQVHVKLEGARFLGYRAMAFFAVRDPMIMPHVDEWLAKVKVNAERNLHLQGSNRISTQSASGSTARTA